MDRHRVLRHLSLLGAVAVGSAFMIFTSWWRVGLAFAPSALLLPALVVFTVYSMPGLKHT